MNRCTTAFLNRRLFGSIALAAAASASLLAQAQGLPSNDTRNFPPTALFGELTITNFPEVAINGAAIRTTPGFRLFDAKNRLVFAHTLQGQTFTVNYVIEPSTQWLHQAWILTPDEAKDKLPSQR